MRCILLACCCLSLVGCLVGPNYHPPTHCMPTSFSENREIEINLFGDESLAHWWTFFNDPFLDALLSDALQRNFDLKIAIEKICQTRAAYWSQVAACLPEIDSDLQITRSRTSQTLNNVAPFNFQNYQTFYQAGVDAIWQIDFFGSLRRQARAARDLWEASIEDARAVKIILLSDVASTYINICALQQTKEVMLQSIALNETLLSLSEARFLSGLAGEIQLQEIVAHLEEDQADLILIDTYLKQSIYSLATLLGCAPESLIDKFSIARPIPTATGAIPVGLPSDLLRRRPDIRSAERQIAAATEQIGVAIAAFFPQFSLTGSSLSYSANPLQGANFGFASNSFTKWFTAPSRIWGIGGILSLPLFDFGKRLAGLKSQVCVEHQALLIYEKTVIAALQEVESDLVAYFNEEMRLQNLNQEVEANRKRVELMQDLFQAGLSNLSEVLNAEEIWLTCLMNFIASKQALSTDLIALYKALGGGWECCSMR